MTIQEMDVTSEASIAACASAVAQTTPRLDLVFNVAGVLHVPGAVCSELSLCGPRVQRKGLI